MNPNIRDRINRKLETLSDERLYQVLDYVEFLESKYAEKPAPVTNVFQRFTDGVEDTLRAGGLAVGTVTEAMGFLNKAMGVLGNVAQTTKNVAADAVSVARSAVDQIGSPGTSGSPGSSGLSGSPGSPQSGANQPGNQPSSQPADSQSTDSHSQSAGDPPEEQRN